MVFRFFLASLKGSQDFEVQSCEGCFTICLDSLYEIGVCVCVGV